MTFQEAYQAVKPIIGQQVYEICFWYEPSLHKGKIEIYEHDVKGVIDDDCDCYDVHGACIIARENIPNADYRYFSFDDLDKTVFLTRDEAEKEKVRLLNLVSENRTFLEAYFDRKLQRED